MNEILKPALALFIITAVFTFILALTNLATMDIIAQNRHEARANSMVYVLPGAYIFSSDVDFGNTQGLINYAIGFDENDSPIGVVMQVSVTGFSPNLIFLVGVDLNGVVTGLDVINHAETPGLGSLITQEQHRHQFIGATGNVQVITGGNAIGNNQVDAIIGATVTMQVVADGVNEALEYINANVLPNIS